MFGVLWAWPWEYAAILHLGMVIAIASATALDPWTRRAGTMIRCDETSNGFCLALCPPMQRCDNCPFADARAHDVAGS